MTAPVGGLRFAEQKTIIMKDDLALTIYPLFFVDVRGTRESDSEPESNGSDDDDDDGELSEAENSSAVAKKTHTHTRSTIQKKTKTSKSRKTRIIATDSRIATLLVNVVNSGNASSN
jgi:hypothetical protein